MLARMSNLTRYFGWLPFWAGIMSGTLSVAREAVSLFADQPSQFWQRSVFWSCVWIAFVVSMFAWVYQKERELRAEKAKHAYPDIGGKVLKVFVDCGFGERELIGARWYILIKMRLSNTGADTNIATYALTIETSNSSYLAVEKEIKGLRFYPDPEFDRIGEREEITGIGGREKSKPLITGMAEEWWFRGEMPESLVRGLEGQILKAEGFERLIFHITDGYGRPHQIIGARPWNMTGQVRSREMDWH